MFRATIPLIAFALVLTACSPQSSKYDPARDYFRAESESEWIDTLNALEPEVARERGRNALERAAERYDRDRIAEQFLRTTREL